MKYLKYLCIGFLSVFMLCGCEEQYSDSNYCRCYCYASSYYSYVEVSSNYYGHYQIFPNETFEVGILYSRTNSTPDFNQSGTMTKSQNVKSESGGYLGTTKFYYSDMNLVSKKEYYVRGYIRNKSSIVYSDIKTFTAP